MRQMIRSNTLSPYLCLNRSFSSSVDFKVFDDCVRVFKDGMIQCVVVLCNRFCNSLGDAHDFHYFWLYHNCDSWLHPKTRERMIDIPDVDLVMNIEALLLPLMYFN
jgi:hypothetical protein